VASLESTISGASKGHLTPLDPICGISLSVSL